MPTTPEPFYPKLNRLISAPDLPDFLGFLQNPLEEAIDAIIGKLGYKNLIVRIVNDINSWRMLFLIRSRNANLLLRNLITLVKKRSVKKNLITLLIKGEL